MKQIISFLLCWPFALLAQQNQAPVVTNLNGQLSLAAKKMTIQF